jgi:hypothetical protein
MTEHDYNRRELTMNAAQANVYALVFVIPILLLFGLPYYLIWLKDFDTNALIRLLEEHEKMPKPGVLWVLLALGLGIILHELIHGLAFMFFCKNGFKSIQFGIMWQFLTPYCHCKEPLRVQHYIIGAFMPAIVLGFLPAGLGIVTGRIMPLLFGIFFSFAAGGDFLIVWLLRNQPKNTLVLDHESKVGCYILEKQNN